MAPSVLETPVFTEYIRNFDLDETLNCGQCFRWKQLDDGSWEAVAFEKKCRISMNHGIINLFCASEEEYHSIWRPYFDLDRDYGALVEAFSQDPVLSEACRFAPGIRVLHQEPWEALCTFILSQNNNIPRIRGLVERLCIHFGAPLVDGDYAFPSPEALACLTPDDLSPVRAGFRAKYLIDAAKKVASGALCLDKIAAMELPEARQALQTIQGVGPKVADCALLYGFHKLSCCPMDVWMKKAMTRLFPHGFPDCAKGVEGIAQQYVFHYSRMHPELFTEV